MQNLISFLKIVPNKVKALYLLWFTIHFTLYLLSGNIFRIEYDFFPFVKYNWDNISATYLLFNIGVYDYSEFFIYMLTPILIYRIIFLWRKK